MYDLRESMLVGELDDAGGAPLIPPQARVGAGAGAGAGDLNPVDLIGVDLDLEGVMYSTKLAPVPDGTLSGEEAAAAKLS
jgi:hypothetical protein